MWKHKGSEYTPRIVGFIQYHVVGSEKQQHSWIQKTKAKKGWVKFWPFHFLTDHEKKNTKRHEINAIVITINMIWLNCKIYIQGHLYLLV